MRHKYTIENFDWLRANRPLYAERELSARFYEEFNAIISPSALAQQCSKRGIKPPTINIGCLRKGNIPFNKGIKGGRVSIATEFKKGIIPKNTLPVGSERFSKDYWNIKVAEPNKWTAKHKVIWESANGTVPKGSAVIFIDSDIRNFSLDNLAVVTRAELLQMNRNKYKQMPGELKPTILALSKLEAKIYQVRACND